MRKLILSIVTIMALNVVAAVAQKVSSGKLERHNNFKSEFVSDRDVYVWLPEDYTPKKKYAVLYMHDGQMLFDGSTTWNGQAWDVDKAAARVMNSGKTRDFIVVGVANVSKERFYDYFPQKALAYIAEDDELFKAKTRDNTDLIRENFSADNYLKFLVSELKPFIDKKYATQGDVNSTFVMGSSMGGLISVYALCEYPNVFGGAAAVSMHSPMVMVGTPEANAATERYAAAFRKYLSEHLPKANSRLLYIDRGDKTLDSLYQPFHEKVDSLILAKGWNDSKYLYKVFPGTAHTETDWAKRLNNPLQFLMPKNREAQIKKVEPEFWWSGMKNSELQLMVYGDNISLYTPSVNHKNVKIKRADVLDSPNYLVIYLDTKDAEAGVFDIVFTRGKHKITYKYELKNRVKNASGKEGFNSSDVVYLLMPDRFANGNPGNDNARVENPDTLNRNDVSARHGGDLAGIKDKADYLADLGITALWTTPVLRNDMGPMSYHGYAITDYYQVDPRLGSNAEYAELVKTLHSKGIKVIMDMVFNHCGSKHQWFEDNPAFDWFNNNKNEYVQTNHNKNIFFDPYASDMDYRTMTDGWFVEVMPDLNQRNKHLEKYLIQNSIWWVEFADLNGIRQDTYPYPDKEMMERWCKSVLEEYPDLNIVGEIMVANPVSTSYWQDSSALKTVMDFTLSEIAPAAFTDTTNWNSGLQRIHEYLSYDYCYKDINNVMRLLENHDMSRFYETLPSDVRGYKQALALMLTIPGIPQLYYGQELLEAGSAKVDYGYIRPDMKGGWKEDSSSVFEASGRNAVQQDMFNYLRTILRWRKGNDVIAKGKMKHFQVRKGVYVYERSLGDKNVIVMMNGLYEDVDLSLDYYKEILSGNRTYRDIITNQDITLEGSVKIPSKGIYILESR